MKNRKIIKEIIFKTLIVGSLLGTAFVKVLQNEPMISCLLLLITMLYINIWKLEDKVNDIKNKKDE